MAGLYFTDDLQMKQAQKDILWTQQTSTNELLTANSVAALNQKLNTSSKKVIGAVNELLVKSVQMGESLTKNSKSLTLYIGNIFSEGSEDLLKLQEIGPNVVGAVVNVRDSVQIAKAEAIQEAKAYSDSKVIELTIIDAGTF